MMLARKRTREPYRPARPESIARLTPSRPPADPTFLPTAEAWRAFGRLCFTCGQPAVGRFADGSPSYDHRHPPIRL